MFRVMKDTDKRVHMTVAQRAMWSAQLDELWKVAMCNLHTWIAKDVLTAIDRVRRPLFDQKAGRVILPLACYRASNAMFAALACVPNLRIDKAVKHPRECDTLQLFRDMAENSVKMPRGWWKS